ncbi:hypothetical protein CTJ10_12675, partial [Staphylococcus epidermidis]
MAPKLVLLADPAAINGLEILHGGPLGGAIEDDLAVANADDAGGIVLRQIDEVQVHKSGEVALGVDAAQVLHNG